MQLYGVQQQLARQQVLLEREQDEVHASHSLREQREETLTHLRGLYRQMQDQMKTERQQSEATTEEFLEPSFVPLSCSAEAGSGGGCKSSEVPG